MNISIHRIIFLITFIFPLLIGVSCTNTSKILELNSALTNLHTQDLQLDNQSKTNGSNSAKINIARQSINSQYSIITSEVTMALKNEKDTKSRISLYRIGASAAWQGEINGLSSFYTEGNRLCNSENRVGWNLSPRDCYILSVIPEFEGNDESFIELQKLRAINESSNTKQTQVISETLTNKFLSRIKGVQTKSKGVGDHPSLLRLIEAQKKRMACNAWEAWGLHHGTKQTRVKHDALAQQIVQVTETQDPRAACDNVSA